MAHPNACIGCGIVEKEPTDYVAVVRGDDGRFVHKSICTPCWKDPEHRTLGPVKAHFFPRARADAATQAAGSSSIVMS
jgi:hypothetical protein